MVMAAERMDSIYQQAFLQAGVEFRSWLDQPITDPGSRKAEFRPGKNFSLGRVSQVGPI